MQPFSYLVTPAGLIWTISCIPLGIALTVLGYFIINRIPATWLCDYNETPSEELLSGKRIKFMPSGIFVSLVMAVCLALCRLQFNKGYDIYFAVLALILFDCMLIAVADIKYQIIPDQFTVALGILAVGISVYDIARGYHIFHSTWWSPLAGAGIGAAAMLLIDFIGMLVYKRDGMGFGDVKLFLAVGVLTGFPGTIYTFIISIITATIFFVAIILTARISGGKEDSEEPVQEASGNAAEEAADQESGEEKPDEENTSATDDQDSGNDKQDEQTEENGSVGFGSYLAFGPYIAIALGLYIVLFDYIMYLARLYLDLFNF